MLASMPHLLACTARKARPAGPLFNATDYDDVARFFGARPELKPTPLYRLSSLAAALGLGEILLKDESSRFGLNAFKIAGVTYAIDRMAREGRLAGTPVLACATEGNHGRAVARAARARGLAARIYMRRTVAPSRIDAIRGEGAEVVLVEGAYDDAVRRLAEDARRHGWTIVSDTSWPGYEDIPRWIMLGYTHILQEACVQWAPGPPPDIALVQAGVGGLLCAAASWFYDRSGPRRPVLVGCEPGPAACVMASARAGRPTPIEGPLDTMMAGLRCAEMSPAAWPAIAAAVDAFVAIDDEWAARAVRALARPAGADPAVVAGPSGACGLGALLAILGDGALGPVCDTLRLGRHSRVLLINTEGLTDPELYAQILGESAGAVRSGRA